MNTTLFKRTVILCAALACALFRSSGAAVAADVETSDYKIEPLDTISVYVFGETNLCLDCKVQASGEISYPLLGSVKVADRTSVEAQNMLRTLLEKDYLVNPQVIVRVVNYRQRTVSVLGQVTKPDAYIIPEEQKWSIVDAIAHAGGLTKLGRKSRIEFTRGGALQTFNFDQLLKDSKDPSKVIWLKPGDVINVPETLF